MRVAMGCKLMCGKGLAAHRADAHSHGYRAICACQLVGELVCCLFRMQAMHSMQEVKLSEGWCKLARALAARLLPFLCQQC